MPKGIYATVGSSTMYYDPTSKDIVNYNLILMSGERPDGLGYAALEDGNWGVIEDAVQVLYEAELATLDPLLSHVLRHELNGETERAARAEHELLLAQARLLEKFGRGNTVYVTASGSCYHVSEDCSALGSSSNILEINESDGLENYTPCSICCN